MQTRLLKFVTYAELESGEIAVFDPETAAKQGFRKRNLLRREDGLVSAVDHGTGVTGGPYCIIGLADPIAQYRELGRLYDLEKQFEKLVAERDETVTSLKKQYIAMKEQRDHLDHCRVVLEADVKALKCNCADSKKALEHEIATGDKLRAELHEVKEERDQLKKERDELAQQLTIVRGINRERKVATHEANAALRKQVSTLQSERNGLQNALNSMRHLSADLTARCVQAEEKLRVLKHEKNAGKTPLYTKIFVHDEYTLKASDIARRICRDMTELPDAEPFDHPRLLKVFKFKDLKPGEVVIPHGEMTEEESEATCVVRQYGEELALQEGITYRMEHEDAQFLVVGLPGVDQCNTMCSLVNTYNRVLSERNALAEIRDVALADAQDWRERHGEVSDALGDALGLIEKLHTIYHG